MLCMSNAPMRRIYRPGSLGRLPGREKNCPILPWKPAATPFILAMVFFLKMPTSRAFVRKGVAFIGPSGDVIAQNGRQNQAARASMIAAVFPAHRGADGNLKDPDEAIQVAAEKIGYRLCF